MASMCTVCQFPCGVLQAARPIWYEFSCHPVPKSERDHAAPIPIRENRSQTSDRLDQRCRRGRRQLSRCARWMGVKTNANEMASIAKLCCSIERWPPTSRGGASRRSFCQCAASPDAEERRVQALFDTSRHDLIAIPASRGLSDGLAISHALARRQGNGNGMFSEAAF